MTVPLHPGLGPRGAGPVRPPGGHVDESPHTPPRVSHPPSGRVSSGPTFLPSDSCSAEHDLEDGQGRPRFHVVGGDVEPVPPVRDGHLRGTGTVLLRVHDEVPGGDPRPVKRPSVRTGRCRCDPRPHVFLGHTHPLGEEGHDLQDRAQVQIDRIVPQGAREPPVGLLAQLRLEPVLAQSRGQAEDSRHFLHLGGVDVRIANAEVETPLAA